MMEKYNHTMQTITYAVVVLCTFLLPWNFLVPQCGTFLVFFWLITFDYREKRKNIRAQPMYWLFLAFTVLYIAGYFWSDNKTEAVISLAVKVSVFIFPLIFASLRYNYKQTKLVLQSFLAGLITVGCFMLIRAVVTGPQKDVDLWTYQQLSRDIMHPSYLSLYFVAGIMVCFHGILLRDVPMKKKALAGLLVLFFCIMIFMLSSKTGIISLVVVFLFYIGYAVVRFRRYVVAGVSLLVLITGFFVALQTFPALKARLHAMTEVISSDKPIDPSESESNRVRLLIWQQDLQLIMEHPLTGVGTGDVQVELMKKYIDAGMTGAFDKKLNAHSQFFQTGIAVGLPGIIILLGILLGSFTWAIRRRFGFAALLTVLIAFNFIPESMLQVQAGTLFFGFFFSFILFAADPAVLSPETSRQKAFGQ